MSHDPNKRHFPDPWEYFEVPEEDRKDLLQLYVHTHVNNTTDLAMSLDKITYSPESAIGRTYVATQSAEATQAAMWFIVADFLAMKYFRTKNAHKMKPVPKEILQYLVYPYNQMTSLAYEDQIRFRDSLPPNQREAVYIDE